MTIYAGSDSDKSIVYLCDSLQKSHVKEVVIKQICRIRNCNSTTIKRITQPVQQQLNAFDCGVYAVAYATDLANNIDPTNSSYETQNIRDHLSSCLERGSLKPFPTTDKRTQRGKAKSCNLKLYCTCRMPFFVSGPDEDEGLFMASCCICEDWYNKKCENVNVSVFKVDKKTQQMMCKGCKIKTSIFIFSVASFILLLMTKTTSRNDILLLIRLCNIRKLPQ